MSNIIKTNSIKEVKDFVETISAPLTDFIGERELQVAKLGFTQAVYRNKEIAKCEAPSVIGAFLQCAIYGLDPTQGEAYFIPRSVNIGDYHNPNWVDFLNYETGYQGYLKIYEDLGYFIETVLVCSEDKIITPPRKTQDGWEFAYEPIAKRQTKENILYGFTTITYPNGLKKCFKTSIDEIEDMRKKSKNQVKDRKSRVPSDEPLGVWAEWYGEMARKTCVRRARKWIGRSLNKNGVPLVDEGILSVSDYGIEAKGMEYNEDQFNDKITISGTEKIKLFAKENNISIDKIKKVIAEVAGREDALSSELTEVEVDKVINKLDAMQRVN